MLISDGVMLFATIVVCNVLHTTKGVFELQMLPTIEKQFEELIINFNFFSSSVC
jgi:hypothetical protein